MFLYFAYGLKISSNLEIPEFLVTESSEFDVAIEINQEIDPYNYIPKVVIDKPWYLQLTKEKTILYVRETGVFLINNGNQVVILPLPGVAESHLRFYLVGTVMGILLYQRDYLVLHASAVNINGGAVAFLGVSGEGKSSTAAAFLSRGYNLITDDVAPVTLEQNIVTMTPGFPQIKLGQETASILGYDFASLQAIHPSVAKRAYQAKDRFSSVAVPIKRIYLLASDANFSIEAIRPSESIVEICRHSRPTTLYHSGGAVHFFQCANLAREHTLYRLKRPRNLKLLPQLVATVEEHLDRELQLIR